MEHTLGEQARCGHGGPLAALGAEWPVRGDRGWERRGAEPERRSHEEGGAARKDGWRKGI